MKCSPKKKLRLLRGETLEDVPAASQSLETEEIKVEDHLSPIEIDALGEVGNISFGSSATALSSLLGQKVDITTPSISMINRNRLEQEFPHPYVVISSGIYNWFIGYEFTRN